MKKWWKRNAVLVGMITFSNQLNAVDVNVAGATEDLKQHFAERREILCVEDITWMMKQPEKLIK